MRPHDRRKGFEMKRLLLLSLLTVALLGLLASPAMAFSCGVVNKPDGAGSAGTATVDVATGDFTITSQELNPAGKLKGNFLTVTAVAGSQVLSTDDIFIKKDLPAGAHNAGPGDSECDGIGIDDFASCGP